MNWPVTPATRKKPVQAEEDSEWFRCSICIIYYHEPLGSFCIILYRKPLSITYVDLSAKCGDGLVRMSNNRILKANPRRHIECRRKEKKHVVCTGRVWWKRKSMLRTLEEMRIVEGEWVWWCEEGVGSSLDILLEKRQKDSDGNEAPRAREGERKSRDNDL